MATFLPLLSDVSSLYRDHYSSLLETLDHREGVDIVEIAAGPVAKLSFKLKPTSPNRAIDHVAISNLINTLPEKLIQSRLIPNGDLSLNIILNRVGAAPREAPPSSDSRLRLLVEQALAPFGSHHDQQ